MLLDIKVRGREGLSLAILKLLNNYTALSDGNYVDQRATPNLGEYLFPRKETHPVLHQTVLTALQYHMDHDHGQIKGQRPS